MIASLFRFLVCLSVLSLIAPATHAQEHSNNLAEIYAPVDANLRPRLAERLKVFVEYNRKQQWDAVYNLTYKPFFEDELKQKNRDEFVRNKQLYGGGSIIGFFPQKTETGNWRDEGYYQIEGCMKNQSNGKIEYQWGGVRAYLVNAEWYFEGPFIKIDYHYPSPTCSSKDVD